MIFGEPAENALLRLQNSFPVRFVESGSLLNLRHKYLMRLCFNTQREIHYASREEVQQISQIHPNIGRWLFAPCSSRWIAHITPFCPEGERYCGQPLWNKGTEEYPPRII